MNGIESGIPVGEHLVVVEAEVGMRVAVAIIHISTEVILIQHIVVDNYIGVVTVVILDADVTVSNLPLEFTIPVV